MYLRHFWKILPSVFTLDFWRVNPKLKKLNKHLGAESIYKAKKWAKKHGYYWDNSFYMEGEKFLSKNGVAICMCQPYTHEVFTREFSHIDDDGTVHYNSVFLLNHNKTANYLFQNFILKEQYHIFLRDMKYNEINKKYYKDKQKYINSEEFLKDLHYLSFGNYYDLLDLKNNMYYSNKEKRDFVGDFCDYLSIDFNDYISFEETESKENDNFNWTDDIIATAVTKNDIDSIIVINPNKLYGIKITKRILQRMHKKYF